MRVAVALLASLSLFAGCFGNDNGGNDETDVPPPLLASDIVVPTGGVLQEVANGFAVLLNATALPFTTEVAVPAHATMIRAVALDQAATSVSMSNVETGRRRCNNPTVESFNLGFQAPRSCSGVSVIDAPGALWRVNIGGAGTSDVVIEFLDAPLDGISSQLDFTLIDPPVLDLQDTVVEFIPSFDGVLLRTERTLPAGNGPWPTVIVSSPYYTHGPSDGPADWNYVVQDWAKRGYAMVTADVRGFADSGGCVEVWGINEQQDQKFLVDCVAEQPWSDGNVGFYGQSYVGTTPVAAAVQAPPALKAIVTIAPVINAYEDWHYGGVPNGENELSPVAYQVLTESLVTESSDPGFGDGGFLSNPQLLATKATNGFCDPTLVARANDPRAIYNDFYEERNFKLRAKDVTAAVLYTEGFEDANVKAAMIPGWFNDLESPKLGLFGHWLHQHPSRLDCEALFVGWFEQYLKGKDIGFEKLPPVDIQVNREMHRTDSEWPSTRGLNVTFWPDFGTGALEGTLGTEAVDGRQVLYLDPAGAGTPEQPNAQTTMPPLIRLTTALTEDVPLVGSVTLHIVAIPQNAPNAYFGAYLYEDTAAGANLVTWGQFNMAHRNGHDTYEPAQPNVAIGFDLPMRPTEHILSANSTLRLEIRGVAAAEATDPFGVVGARTFIEAGADGTYLSIPTVPISEYRPIPLTVVP